MMQYALPVMILLSLMNFYYLLAPALGDVGTNIESENEFHENVRQDRELVKAQREILILKALLNSYRKANTHHLRLTAYTARPEECNDDVENTAIMQSPIPEWTVAVSRDLRGWLGKRIYIEGFGVRLVSDLMNARYTKSIDLLVADLDEARRIGVKADVFVTLIEPLALKEKQATPDLHRFFAAN